MSLPSEASQRAACADNHITSVGGAGRHSRLLSSSRQKGSDCLFELENHRKEANQITNQVKHLKIANNVVIRSWGEKRLEPELKNHVDRVRLLGIVDTKRALLEQLDEGLYKGKDHVHLLNSTLTATERTMCCILENYQKRNGAEVPEVLRNFMGGKTFLPFNSKSGS
ncbi:Serine--tRNA ligase [Morus notabilis]|uniref:Serine--tRNA ligase n=1 Tax=Morus notabilis TaxID=981085 RepID=W9QUQ3_9ROSA|nr:Serine--tRNA ligase [Morus notabilis]